LYKSLKLIVMKLIASKCNFMCQKCAKTHLRAFVALKNFPGAKPPDPQHYREGREGKGSEGKEGKRWEGRGGRAEKGKGRRGKGRRGGRGKGEVNPPPPANPRSATG
jgi:hypothetical protein